MAPGCSSPLPDLTGVNNRERMIKTAEIAGGISQSIDMAWLKTGLIDIKDELLIDPMAAYAVLVPGCSLAKPQKRWPSESFAAVGANLLARGLKVYVVGTKEDRVAVSGVLTHSPSIVDLSEKTSLPVLAKLFQGASYVIGNDTGPVFLAAKAGAKTLMIMGPDTDPEMSAPSGRACTWLQGKPISDVSVRSALNSLSKLN